MQLPTPNFFTKIHKFIIKPASNTGDLIICLIKYRIKVLLKISIIQYF